MTSFKPHCLPEALPPNTITLGVMNLGGGDTNIQFIAGWIETSSNVEGFYSGPICVIVMVYWLPFILQV